MSVEILGDRWGSSTTLTSPMFGSVADPSRPFSETENMAPTFEPHREQNYLLTSNTKNNKTARGAVSCWGG